jgi:hypothetical protein
MTRSLPLSILHRVRTGRRGAGHLPRWLPLCGVLAPVLLAACADLIGASGQTTVYVDAMEGRDDAAGDANAPVERTRRALPLH